MLSTLDILSGGRVMLGVGAGWSTIEFDGYSEWLESKQRVDKTIEALEIIRKLWTEDEVTYKGKFYEMKGAVLEPKPLQKPYPRLLFGSSGRRMLNLTGKYGDICFIPPWMRYRYQEIKNTVVKAAEKAGRVDKLAFMGGDMGLMGPYSIDDHARKVETAVDSGVEYYSTAFPRHALIESMRRFTEEVMPSFK
jgi:alkanesulfonate monooxygenase SsuD/methylene tetrahydromethanopterin reductase-like flavin-dependent oxidoreductase (luciferase family)